MIFHFLESIDKRILIWINQTLSNYGFDFFMPLITNENNWIIPILLLVIYLGLIGGKRGQIALVLMILAIGITDSFSSYVLKPYFARIRPSYTLIDPLTYLFLKVGNGVCHQITLGIFMPSQLLYPIFIKSGNSQFIF